MSRRKRITARWPGINRCAMKPAWALSWQWLIGLYFALCNSMLSMAIEWRITFSMYRSALTLRRYTTGILMWSRMVRSRRHCKGDSLRRLSHELFCSQEGCQQGRQLCSQNDGYRGVGARSQVFFRWKYISNCVIGIKEDVRGMMYPCKISIFPCFRLRCCSSEWLAWYNGLLPKYTKNR